MSLRPLALLVFFVALLTGATTAQAAPGGVAYIKDGQVWVAKLDGSKKVQLSSGDAWWNDVGQSAGGGIVGTKNEPGKIAQLTTFTVWNPDGTEKDFGPASPGLNFSGSLAFPLGLELDSSNGLIVYGFSEYVYGFPVGTLTQGYALLPTATRSTPPTTLTETFVRWPAIVGERIVGTPDSHVVSVQDAGGLATQSYTPWFDTSGIPDSTVHQTQVSDDGKVAAAEIDLDLDHAGTAGDTSRIAMLPFPGLGGTLQSGDCFLPASGAAPDADVSADGDTIAWADADGVKVSGKPTFSGADPCVLTRPAVLIDAGGTHPALGPIDVDALYAARNPAPTPTPALTPTPTTTTTTPTVTVPAPGQPPTVLVPQGLTAGALLAPSGASIDVGTGKAGAITVTVKVKAGSVGRRGRQIVIATGTARATKRGALKIKLKPTKAGKKLKKKLRGKKVTITITAGGRTTRTTITLR